MALGESELLRSVQKLLDDPRGIPKRRVVGQGVEGMVLDLSDDKHTSDRVVKLNRHDWKDMLGSIYVSETIAGPDEYHLLPSKSYWEDDGQILMSVMKKNEPFPTWFAELRPNNLKDMTSLGRVLRDIACGLANLHASHFAHMDVKPDNFLVDNKQQGFLGDFGSVRTLGLDQYHLLGTRFFLAPEFVTKSDRQPVVIHSSMDMWSYGMSLLWVLTDLLCMLLNVPLDSLAPVFDTVTVMGLCQDVSTWHDVWYRILHRIYSSRSRPKMNFVDWVDFVERGFSTRLPMHRFLSEAMSKVFKLDPEDRASARQMVRFWNQSLGLDDSESACRIRESASLALPLSSTLKTSDSWSRWMHQYQANPRAVSQIQEAKKRSDRYRLYAKTDHQTKDSKDQDGIDRILAYLQSRRGKLLHQVKPSALRTLVSNRNRAFGNDGSWLAEADKTRVSQSALSNANRVVLHSILDRSELPDIVDDFEVTKNSASDLRGTMPLVEQNSFDSSHMYPEL